MKKKILSVLLAFAVIVSLFPSMGIGTASAATEDAYIPLEVSGFNKDVVVENTVVLSGSLWDYAGAFDGDNEGARMSLYEHRGGSSTYGLPSSRDIGDGKFTLQPYTQNNVLQLYGSSSSETAKGSLEFAIQTGYPRIAFLGAGGNGPASFEARITYTDGTTSETLTATAPDWYLGSYSGFYQGPFGRVKLDSGATENGNGPNLYAFTIETNQYKAIKSIDFVYTSGGNKRLNIMAVSGVIPANTHTINFKGNGGGIGIMVNVGGISGAYTLPENGYTPKTGYTFLGWATSKTGGELLQPGTEIAVNSDITLYAQWKAPEGVTGSDTIVDLTRNIISVNDDGTVSVSEFASDGYFYYMYALPVSIFADSITSADDLVKLIMDGVDQSVVDVKEYDLAKEADIATIRRLNSGSGTGQVFAVGGGAEYGIENTVDPVPLYEDSIVVVYKLHEDNKISNAYTDAEKNPFAPGLEHAHAYGIYGVYACIVESDGVSTDPATDISDKFGLTVVGSTYTVNIGEYQLASGHSWVYKIDGADPLSDYLWNTDGIAVVPSGTYNAGSWSKLDANNSCTYENATLWSVMLCCDVDENGGVVAYAWLPLANATPGEPEKTYVITLDETNLTNGYTEVWFYNAEGEYSGILSKVEGYSKSLSSNEDTAIVAVFPADGYTFETLPVVTANGVEVECAGNEDGNFWFYKINKFTEDTTIVINGAAVAPKEPELASIDITIDQGPTFDAIVDGESLPDLYRLIEMGILSADVKDTDGNSLDVWYKFAEWMYAPIGGEVIQDVEYGHVANTSENVYFIKLYIGSDNYLVDAEVFAEAVAGGTGLYINNENGNAYAICDFDFLRMEEVESRNIFTAIIVPAPEDVPEETYVVTLDESNLKNAYAEVWLYDDAGNYDGKLSAENGYSASLSSNDGSATVAIFPADGYTFETLPVVTANGVEVECTGDEDGNFWYYVIEEFTEDTTILINGAAVTVGGKPEVPDTPVIPPRPVNPSYNVNIVDVQRGSVLVTPKTATEGSTVTVTVTPDEGFELIELIITNAAGTEIKWTAVGGNKYTFVMPSGTVNVNAVFGEIKKECPGDSTCPIWPFKDAQTTAWYHDGVHYCIENGLMNGLPGDLFDPNGTTTRAQIVTILWRLEGKPVVNYAMSFNDVAADQWYTEAIRWAAAEGIVNGYSDAEFAPNAAITREQMVAILYRYCQYKGIDVSVGEETNILSYTDAFDIHSWAMVAMQWACGAGVVSGVADGNSMKLDPTGTATRAQVATMLWRFCEEIMNH